MSADDNKTALYHYDPSFGLAIAATAIFGAVFVAHMFLMMRHKAWYMAPFVVGVFGECAGYAVRRISAAKPHNTMLYIVQEVSSLLPSLGHRPWRSKSDRILNSTLQMFIILAPACMAASHYMCFGRLITYVGEKYSPVRARRVTAIFVSFDVASFLIQGGGGALYSGNNANNFRIAKAVLTVGFLIQIVSFGIFAIFAIISRRAGEPAGTWTRCLYTLYIGWYYGLETLPILLCTIFFLISYPGKMISSDRSLRLHPEQANGVHLGTYVSAASTGSDEEKGGIFGGRFRTNY
ncbi:BZ3500_MvSof-1268-A1-R1_Chr2-1g04103 [Microbotryum saponariae]|uniref:BZ3500_MvSof-1268-A1-R1_Chr2-1g04103 protein n=1 Tax=Microbotryum saponariae TaxID=289078 RepID=A0A2X0MAF6_9BASI|nr:BZ3500_MvSof-1268-A1-R1_Chr2-1g04103 [Microbotryum saponariae]SCZ91090.1 BZ3501_MvSof-1269-A2-R1_Chr2-1g03759 [Microbotryum saponariae]